jgi:hypothetical protein
MSFSPIPPQLVTLLAPTPVNGTVSPVPTSAAPLGPAAQVGLELVTTDTLDGAWKIYGGLDPTTPGQALTDITDAFSGSTSGSIPVDHTTTSARQLVFASSPLVMAWVKAIFTPSAGSGKVSASARIG